MVAPIRLKIWVSSNAPKPNKTTKPNLSKDSGIMEIALAIGGVKKAAAVIKMHSEIAYHFIFNCAGVVLNTT